jgi:hypothetical protein
MNLHAKQPVEPAILGIIVNHNTHDSSIDEMSHDVSARDDMKSIPIITLER